MSSRRVGLIAATVLVVLFVLLKYVLPWAGARQIELAVETACPKCQLDLGATEFLLSEPGALVFVQPAFLVETEDGGSISAEATRIVIDVAMLPLVFGRLRFDRVRFLDPQVTIDDGSKTDAPEKKEPAAKKPGEKDLGPVRFAISAVEVTGGAFTLVQTKRGRRAELAVSNISGTIGALGTVDSLREALTKSQAMARLERSGEVKVNIDAKVFAEPRHVDVKIDIRDQNIGDVNRFFGPSEGILLNGRMLQGYGHVAVRGRALDASVDARYEKFDVEFEKSAERSELMAWVSDLAAAVALDAANPDEKRSERTGRVRLERIEQEALVSFILRGLKDAAVEVAKVGSATKPSEKAKSEDRPARAQVREPKDARR